MKKFTIALVAVMSLFLFISSGVFAEDSNPEPVYQGAVYCGVKNSNDMFSEDSNIEQLLFIAFNDADNKTKVVNVLSNLEETAWNQYGEAVDPSSGNAVVVFEKAKNTLTLSGYHYKGEGCYWQRGRAAGYSGIYFENYKGLTIRVEEDSSIDLDGIDDIRKQANSTGILGNGFLTGVNIVGASGAELYIQHGPAGAGITKGGAIMMFGGLSVSTEGNGIPFKLVCRGTDAEEKNEGYEFYGLYANSDDINLTNVELDIESCSKNLGGHSIGIAAGGMQNSVNIVGCIGTVKGGDGTVAAEAIHCGSLNASILGLLNNDLTIKDSVLDLSAGEGTTSSYAITVLHQGVIDGSILTLETDPNAKRSHGLIQSDNEEAKLILKNQSDITLSGKDGAIVYENVEKRELDFSEYGENLKVKAGLNESEAVLLDNPQDCVGYDIPYVHIYAEEDPIPEPVKPVNPTTGIGNSHMGSMACVLTLIALATGCIFCYRKREN